MKNKELLEKAIEMLSGIRPDEIETVQINTTAYSDGSKGLTIELTWPEELEEVISQDNR